MKLTMKTIVALVCASSASMALAQQRTPENRRPRQIWNCESRMMEGQFNGEYADYQIFSKVIVDWSGDEGRAELVMVRRVEGRRYYDSGSDVRQSRIARFSLPVQIRQTDFEEVLEGADPATKSSIKFELQNAFSDLEPRVFRIVVKGASYNFRTCSEGKISEHSGASTLY